MANKLVVKNVMKICVSITLFAVYVYLFGTKSIRRKYLDNEIIITEQEDEDPHWFGNEPPPGIVYYNIS